MVDRKLWCRRGRSVTEHDDASVVSGDVSRAPAGGATGFRSIFGQPSSVGAVRVLLADPAAFTPQYDHELASALGRAGAAVELVTSRFRFGEPPAPESPRAPARARPPRPPQGRHRPRTVAGRSPGGRSPAAAEGTGRLHRPRPPPPAHGLASQPLAPPARPIRPRDRSQRAGSRDVAPARCA